MIHGLVGAIRSLVEDASGSLLAFAGTIRGALTLRCIAIVHVRAHLADNAARRRMAVEFMVSNEIIKECLRGVVVIVWSKVARFWQGGQREATMGSVVAADGLRLGLSIVVMIHFSVLFPEGGGQVEELLHPDGLTPGSISDIELAGSHEERMILLEHVVIVWRVVDEVLWTIGMGDTLGAWNEFRLICSLLDVDCFPKLLDLLRFGEQILVD